MKEGGQPAAAPESQKRTQHYARGRAKQNEHQQHGELEQHVQLKPPKRHKRLEQHEQDEQQQREQQDTAATATPADVVPLTALPEPSRSASTRIRSSGSGGSSSSSRVEPEDGRRQQPVEHKLEEQESQQQRAMLREECSTTTPLATSEVDGMAVAVDAAGSSRNEADRNLPLHQKIECLTLDSDDPVEAEAPHKGTQAETEDGRWWLEVDSAIEADGITDGFFAHGPSIANVAQPAPSAACACGRLPHLCTCEYHRLRQDLARAESIAVDSSESECSRLPARRRASTKRPPVVGEEPRHLHKRRRPA